LAGCRSMRFKRTARAGEISRLDLTNECAGSGVL
jgi:hypothetical protein